MASRSGRSVGAATLSPLLGPKWASPASVQSEMGFTGIAGLPQVSQQFRFVFVGSMLPFPMQRPGRPVASFNVVYRIPVSVSSQTATVTG